MSAAKNSRAYYVESLQTGLSDFWKKIYAEFIQDIAKDWQRQVKSLATTNTSEAYIAGIKLLNERLNESEQRLASLRSRYRIFHTEISQAVTKDAKFELILEFCKYLGSNNARADKRALSRWLDESAVTERWQSRIKDQEFFAAFIMGRIAAVFDLLAFSDEKPDMREMWRELKIESSLTPWIRYAFEAKVQLAAFKSLSSALVSIHDEDAHILSSELLRYTYRFSLDKKQQPELQIEALNLLAVADLNKAIALIQTRLAREDEDDQIFFRESISDIVCLHYLNKPAIFDLTKTLLQDPSPTVRQSVVKALTICDDEDRVMAMVQRLAADESDSVYCYLVTQIPFILTSQYCLAFLLYEFSKPHSYVRLRSLGQALVHWSTLFYGTDGQRQEALDKIYTVLIELATQHSQPDVQYLALDIREKIWAKMESNLDSLLSPVLDATSKARISLKPEQQAAIDSDDGKRWLAANIGHRFSIQLHKKYVQRTDQFGFRMWRFLYELLHPATDKRQHHSHVVARRYQSRHIVPSAILAEVSQTTVPGEPLHMANEGHWRPFLPLVDQLLSALSNGITGRETVLHHIAGKTVIKPPVGIRNLYARTALSVRFSHYARLRNVAYTDEAPDAYVRALEKLGFSIVCNGHPLQANDQNVPVTPAVSRFFDLGVPVVVVQFYQDFQRYFVSVYQNTIQHILVFSLAMVALFWGNHALVSHRIKRDRAKIPMTIGGWGTRGKSGTERLKAALVNSVGLSTVSKTTGCEAMFLFATRYGSLKEMFLFRPYDKATIWEQTFVTRMAARLKSDVLCWECMGLTPRYIDILQQQWMRDDMVTITNCFPDHEDLQGPAGVDVPQVIAKFISKNAKAWTTEDNMLAYLEKEAVEKKADLTHVNWLEIATIPEDLLARFPYEEHPANIALIANMAEEMQLSRTMAIKEMADRVVPDIGVLQVFPYAEVEGREMRFVNGMSANERYGALANWTRLGYEDTQKQLAADYNLVTVINNRADRVPRSKVFARLIAYDFSASKHFIIGNNLDGFCSLAMDAWQERLDAELNELLKSSEFIARCRELAEFLVLPTTEASLTSYLQKVVGDKAQKITSFETFATEIAANEIESIDSITSKHLAQIIDGFKLSQTFVNIEHNDTQVDKALLQQAKTTFIALFKAKLVVVDDYFISGEALNLRIAMQMPSGIKTDIIGLQNIKGPGLDFVYSWQQWQKVHGLLHSFSEGYGEGIESSINELAALPSFSCLDKNAVEAWIESLATNSRVTREDFSLQLDQISAVLSKQTTALEINDSGKPLWQPLLNVVEEFVDIFDAVRRGRLAKRILVDLAAQRISLNNAAWLLMKINKRQKGGWLSSRQ